MIQFLYGLHIYIRWIERISLSRKEKYYELATANRAREGQNTPLYNINIPVKCLFFVTIALKSSIVPRLSSARNNFHCHFITRMRTSGKYAKAGESAH